jgi:glycerol-3-phosphate cytidylyltransferase
MVGNPLLRPIKNWRNTGFARSMTIFYKKGEKMKRVITYGTFDLLHYGHINLLRRAKEYGDYLIVGLSTDEFNWDEKQKKCYFSYEKRKQLLEAIRYVDLVIPETKWGQKVTDIKEYHADTFVMGDDWTGKFDYLRDQTDATVIYLPRTPEISTTQIKRDLGM